jgi:hypothetical protein
MVLFCGGAGQVRSQFLYWGDTYYIPEHGGDLRRAKLDGSGQQILVRGLDAPTGPALDLAGGKMFWADLYDGQIWRANLNGTGLELLLGQQHEPGHLAVDNVGGKMYWTTISRAGVVPAAFVPCHSVTSVAFAPLCPRLHRWFAQRTSRQSSLDNCSSPRVRSLQFV